MERAKRPEDELDPPPSFPEWMDGLTEQKATSLLLELRSLATEKDELFSSSLRLAAFLQRNGFVVEGTAALSADKLLREKREIIGLLHTFLSGPLEEQDVPPEYTHENSAVPPKVKSSPVQRADIVMPTDVQQYIAMHTPTGLHSPSARKRATDEQRKTAAQLYRLLREYGMPVEGAYSQIGATATFMKDCLEKFPDHPFVSDAFHDVKAMLSLAADDIRGTKKFILPALAGMRLLRRSGGGTTEMMHFRNSNRLFSHPDFIRSDNRNSSAEVQYSQTTTKHLLLEIFNSDAAKCGHIRAIDVLL